jgi:HK97 family phage portal protein
MQLSAGLSAQEFAVSWFQAGGVPSAILKNSEKKLDRAEAIAAKESFKASITNGDVWTTGKDWEYTPVAVKAAESAFIEQMQYTDSDLCRFMGVPADMLDVASGNAAQVTYANVTQRNLQLLVMNLGGAVKRREDALSKLTPGGRYVKLNRSAVLAMDDKTRAELFALKVTSRTITPDQVRAYEDQAPLTEADYTQFDRLFGARSTVTKAGSTN